MALGGGVAAALHCRVVALLWCMVVDELGASVGVGVAVAVGGVCCGWWLWCASVWLV